MNQQAIYFGDIKAHFEKPEIKGEPVRLQNENFYKISNSDVMRPFFMSIVSDSNHWMFISSNGGLTAGRKNSEVHLCSLIIRMIKLLNQQRLPEVKPYFKYMLMVKHILGTFFR